MTLKAAINDKCSCLIDDLNELIKGLDITLVAFNEDSYKEKKKAMGLKGSCGTRMTPFVAVFNDEDILIKGFYSDIDECNSRVIGAWLFEHSIDSIAG